MTTRSFASSAPRSPGTTPRDASSERERERDGRAARTRTARGAPRPARAESARATPSSGRPVRSRRSSIFQLDGGHPPPHRDVLLENIILEYILLEDILLDGTHLSSSRSSSPPALARVFDGGAGRARGGARRRRRVSSACPRPPAGVGVDGKSRRDRSVGGGSGRRGPSRENITRADEGGRVGEEFRRARGDRGVVPGDGGEDRDLLARGGRRGEGGRFLIETRGRFRTRRGRP
jgi:hypothetical protein